MTRECVSILRFRLVGDWVPGVRVPEMSTGLSSPTGEASVDLLVVRFPLSARAWATNGGKRVNFV